MVDRDGRVPRCCVNVEQRWLPQPLRPKASQLAKFGSHALIAGEPWEAVLSYLDAFDVQGAKPPTELARRCAHAE